VNEAEGGRSKVETASLKPEVGSPMRDGRSIGELCDYCGAESLRWRKCKLICEACGNIVKSCADL
jgi:predicted amidophosphoribosyltransferase